jgi:exosortase
MRNMTRPSQSETSTKRLVWELAATGVLILVLYYPTLKALVSDWNTDPNYFHGFFVPFICGYLVWEKRAELKKANASPCLWGLPILLTGLFVLIAGTIGSELFTKRFSFLIVLVGALFLLSGKEITRLLLFPIFFYSAYDPNSLYTI